MSCRSFPDEARTFGMEGLFRQVGIYSSVGQLYTPQDSDQLMYYREDRKGQILEEGINEAGAFCSWMAAGTAYANHGINMIPMYIFYSMFGFQRIGDFAWAAGDMQVRGFLIGATAGRTTLAGEGLQHQDGHSQLLASTIPNCVSYDPCYAYELAIIMQDGLRRMYAEQENIYYYVTCMNENYAQPPMPKGVEQGVLRGMYLLHIGGRGPVRATLLGSGTILREALAAAQILETEYKIPADVFSVTSFSELRREAQDAEREAMLHPDAKPRVPYVRECLSGREGPFIAATDYMKIVADQIRQWVPGRYVTLGTDGFGRSDSREALRGFFEVDRRWIVVATLKALADDGKAGDGNGHCGDEAVRHRPVQAESAGDLTDIVAKRITVSVPDLGDFKDVEIIDVLVAAGAEVALETPLITLETDKATMDVPSTAAGRVVELLVKKGDRVSKGDSILQVETEGAAPAPPTERAATAKPAPAPAAAAAPAAIPVQAPAPAAAITATTPAVESGSARAHAGPAVRQLARELGVDLTKVKGSGVKGRITQDDVKAFVKRVMTAAPAAPVAALPRVPDVDFAAFGPVEVRPLGRIQKISATRLQASWVNIPHVTQHEEADVTELEALRVSLKERAASLGIKLTPLAFVARACARVIGQFPNFNSSLDASGQNQVLKQYLHLGFAADTPNGLVVPVIRDANRKDIYELARELAEYAARARAGKLTAAEMQGGCFTISSLGGIGGTAFTPIINAPEVAILGVSRSQTRPVWRDGQFRPRLLMPLSLSYDHRVIDGAEAVRFVVALADALTHPDSLVEAVP